MLRPNHSSLETLAAADLHGNTTRTELVVGSMWQTLFFIPHQVAGLPLFGWGALAAVWAVGSALWMAVLVRRHGWGTDTRGQIPVLVLFGAAIVWLLPHVGDERGLPVRGYGTLLLVAIAAGAALAMLRAARAGIDADTVLSLLFWMVVPGIVGARMFYVVEYWDLFQGPNWRVTLINIAQVTEGGLVVYGGAMGAAAGLVVFGLVERLRGLALVDLVAPSGALAMGLGRLGCFLNGCCYGGPSDLPWAVQFPFGSAPQVAQVRLGTNDLIGLTLEHYDQRPAVVASVVPDSPAAAAGFRPGEQVERVGGRPIGSGEEMLFALLTDAKPGDELLVWVAGVPGAKTWRMPTPLPRSRPIHPTQLYSTIDGVVLALWLLAVTPFCKREGQVFCWYLTWYPLTRFLQEMIRTDEGAALATGLTISQNVSLMLLMVAAGLWWYVSRWGTLRPANPVQPA